MRLLDTTRPVETPEGIELGLRVAGPTVRALAWAIDFCIRILFYIVLLFLSTKLERLGNGLLLVSIFVLEWFYPVLFEVYRQGATPGKSAMKIKVLHESGTPVDWSASMIRNLLRVVDFLPFFYGLGLIAMLINEDFKRIGDLAAGTVVVYQEEIPGFKNEKAWGDESALPMPIVLSLEEQQAIINFADRAQQLPQDRAIELANIVTPLTGKTGEAAIKSLYQLANGLIGYETTHF
ncbi:RDD domain-containing protein [Candidatus Thiomargarita nelsonii]|uniref:RDD domain-containing protein n=1 Tax=Candidatus Thiomargarita nelsonii TaxID=1003181 RepID=A0A176RVX6_9GAMM|nr:RDD domain-containing protein [Candidatus Thiomargarita nelsonii]